MTKLAFVLTALFALYAFTAHAEVLSSYSLPNATAGELKALAAMFGLEHRSQGVFEVEVPASQSALLLSLAPNARLMEADVSGAARKRLQSFGIRADLGYHSFDQVQSWMHAHSVASRDLISVIDYGVSTGGRSLTALHFSGPRSSGKPVVMITAATHGDELITTEVAMDLVDKLVSAYGKDARLTALVDSHDLYFIPVLNADGFSETNRYDGNVDPNRSYPYPGHESATPSPSIAAVMKFFSTLNVRGSLDFHAYGELIMYPWAYTHTPIPPAPHAQLDALTKHMAEANHYTYGPIADVIYIAPGSSADYYFWKNPAQNIAIELGQDKIPDPSEFPAYFASQEESTWRFIEGI
jgi:hypothetical protein